MEISLSESSGEEQIENSDKLRREITVKFAV